jgi:hypothetical protein
MKRKVPRKTARKTARKRAANPDSSPGTPPRTLRPRVAIGPPRPQYLLNDENDRMMMIITALVAEVSALRDRLDTHEALAEKRRFASTAAVDDFALGDARQEVREQARQRMLERVYRVVFEDLDAARRAEQVLATQILNEEVSAS